MIFASVIKYEGDNNTFIWKSPIEDFNSSSQLIVHESQEAVFFMNGQALDSFGPGRHTLETENIPIIGGLLKLATGGQNPFHCEVYFINKTEQLAMKWGTDSKIQFMEPTYNFPIALGCRGELGLQVSDARKLLVKLVGTENTFTHEEAMEVFRAFLMTKIKPYIALKMKEKSISIFEVDEHLGEFSIEVKKLLEPDFAEYGMDLIKFNITGFAKPEEDPAYQKFKELHFRQYADIAEAKLQQQVDIIKAQTEAQKTIIESQALVQKRAQEGYTYAEERSFDIAHAAASNESSGQFTGMGIGIGAMAGVGTSIGSMVGNSMNNAINGAMNGTQNFNNQNNNQNAGMIKCPLCGKDIPTSSKFCPECGAKLGG